MLQIDLRLTPEQIDHFASQTKDLPPPLRHQFMESFSSAESPDFYQGLAAGLAVAFAIGEQCRFPNSQLVIGGALAHAAQHIKHPHALT